MKDFEYLRARTTRRVKSPCAGLLTFGSHIHSGKAYEGVVDVAERFAEVVNRELKGLIAAAPTGSSSTSRQADASPTGENSGQ